MQKGDFVKIDFIGKLESGEIFDLTDEKVAKENNIFNPSIKYKPVTVIIGAGFVVPGLEKALMDMTVGEKKEVSVKPEDAFGNRNPELIKTVPEKAFEGKHVVPGMIVDFGNTRGRIQSISAGRVRVDFNHPLAGKVLKYNVDLKEHIDDQIQQVEAVLDFFGIDPKIYMIPGAYEIEADPSPAVKSRVSSLVLEYVGGVKKVRFVQSYTKKEEKPVETEEPKTNKKKKE
ncbi:MAG: FKBP-type peptidyl-prolyl cis-trans isomerase [Candidatus Aenigmarchaeota archaeon]|nr:FKBP-type peptidyl-prolyl cis-trans isomerase [Candidatus Aenigmarchaeota archaeon]